MQQKINTSFKHHLNSALTNKFGKKITAAYLALQFNLLVEEDLSISRETARKWINGEALPEIRRMKILIDWLKIDANGFLRMVSGQEDASPTYIHYKNNLLEIVMSLDCEGIKLVIYTAWSLQSTSRKKKQSFEEFYKSVLSESKAPIK